MSIDRVKQISREEFLHEYLLKNKPVIVTDAMENWDTEKFTLNSLKENFGQSFVQVYNDLFDLQTVKSLEDYFNDNFGKTERNGKSKEYVRWYSKLKEIDFFWSDDVFEALKGHWQTPYFLPTSELAIPFSGDNNIINSHEARFPYKGLFISGKDSRTRLHRDPFTSNAILCQFYGEKEILLYSPDQEEYVMSKDGEFVDPYCSNLSKFERFSEIEPVYKTILSPKEIVFFPSGWFHDVTCISDSISVTWNFVHKKELDRFCSFIKQNPNDSELETVRFFLKDFINKDASVQQICDFFEKEAYSATP